MVSKLVVLLWRILPLSKTMRWTLLYHGNAHFVAGATAFIQDAEGRILLFEHTYRPQRPWGLPGGWIKRGEKVEAALVREMREESGFEIVVNDLLAAELHPTTRHIDLIYRCRVVGGAFRRSDEVSDYAYSAPSDLPLLVPKQREQINAILERDSSFRRPPR